MLHSVWIDAPIAESSTFFQTWTREWKLPSISLHLRGRLLNGLVALRSFIGEPCEQTTRREKVPSLDSWKNITSFSLAFQTKYDVPYLIFDLLLTLQRFDLYDSKLSTAFRSYLAGLKLGLTPSEMFFPKNHGWIGKGRGWNQLDDITIELICSMGSSSLHRLKKCQSLVNRLQSSWWWVFMKLLEAMI